MIGSAKIPLPSVTLILVPAVIVVVAHVKGATLLITGIPVVITLFKLKMDSGSLKSITAPGGVTLPLLMSIELLELVASNAVIPLYPPPNGIIRHNPAAVDTS